MLAPADSGKKNLAGALVQQKGIALNACQARAPSRRGTVW
jgi:hypothetical protein